MQRSLFVLILMMGQCSFLTCQVFELHFINDMKTWNEAQQHCRDNNFTDLAVVPNEEFNNMFKECEIEINSSWIGLRNTSNNLKEGWRWSLPGKEYTEVIWERNEPNNEDGYEYCAVRKNNGKLIDVQCCQPREFICYDVSSTEKYRYIDMEMNWKDAQKYCREKHTDLLSGNDHLNHPNVKQEGRNNDVWVGLFSDTWEWSDNSSYSYRNWRQCEYPPENDLGNCAVVAPDGKWKSAKCEEKRAFFCYEDHTILVKENLTFEEALYYCSGYHGGLVSIHNAKEDLWVKKKAKDAQSRYIWLGLLYSCPLDLWFWVNDRMLDYQNWATGGQTHECQRAVAMDKENDYKWVTIPDNERSNFICFKR